MHDAYTKASITMNELFYDGLSFEDINHFESFLKKIIKNLEQALKALF